MRVLAGASNSSLSAPLQPALWSALAPRGLNTCSLPAGRKRVATLVPSASGRSASHGLGLLGLQPSHGSADRGGGGGQKGPMSRSTSERSRSAARAGEVGAGAGAVGMGAGCRGREGRGCGRGVTRDRAGTSLAGGPGEPYRSHCRRRRGPGRCCCSPGCACLGRSSRRLRTPCRRRQPGSCGQGGGTRAAWLAPRHAPARGTPCPASEGTAA